MGMFDNELYLDYSAQTVLKRTVEELKTCRGSYSLKLDKAKRDVETYTRAIEKLDKDIAALEQTIKQLNKGNDDVKDLLGYGSGQVFVSDVNKDAMPYNSDKE
jgi:predicted  nucleic acid-binding Zn-ribbon protein